MKHAKGDIVQLVEIQHLVAPSSDLGRHGSLREFRPSNIEA